jgi:hypothetical protein
MSVITKAAIVSALEADSVFTSLLASDPNSPGRPALFNASMNELTPVYNSVTFREAGSKPVREFAAPMPGDIQGRVEAEQFDFEVWTKDASVSGIEAIRARLDALLNQQSLSLGTAGRVFWSERTITSADNWDPKLLARYGLFRYRLLVEYM